MHSDEKVMTILAVIDKRGITPVKRIRLKGELVYDGTGQEGGEKTAFGVDFNLIPFSLFEIRRASDELKEMCNESQVKFDPKKVVVLLRSEFKAI